MDSSDLPYFVINPDYHLISSSFDTPVRDLDRTDHARCVNHFDPAISIGRRAIDFAQFQGGIVNINKNYFAWENISKIDTDLKFVMLGHTLHLLEDMGCPPHVRKDKHGGTLLGQDFLLGGESDYEILCGINLWGIKYTSIDSARIKANSQVADKSTLTEYFESLRDITQKGYFSRDTMFSDDFEQNFTPINDENSNYIYKNNTGGTRLAYKGLDFWNSYNFWYRFYFLKDTNDRETAAYNKAKKQCNIDYYVAKDYFNELEIPIIKHCAGVINLFYETFMVSKNSSPIISNISVSGQGIGNGGTGDITITYDLEDTDNDNCNITIEYQGGSIGTTWTTASITGESSGISPGAGKSFVWHSAIDEEGCNASDYKIRIIPYDGTDTGTAGVSSEFSINNSPVINSPPIATISSPADNSTFAEDKEITFTGAGVDDEDRTLTGDSLIWSSDKDGRIGTGEFFSLSNLSVNAHTINLTVTDQQGTQNFTTIKITIIPSTISVGQGASTEAIKNHFIDCYNRNGGQAVLFDPASAVYDWNGYWRQDFSKSNSIIIYNPTLNSAYLICGAILTKWTELNHVQGSLGLPIEEDAAVIKPPPSVFC